MAYETIIVETEDHVTLIRLNRPDALNALNAQLLGELTDALKAAQANEKVRCIVITGSEKAFAAGADIKEMSGKSFNEVFTADLFGPEAEAIRAIRKPIIAAVAGYALGGGCELAMIFRRQVEIDGNASHRAIHGCGGSGARRAGEPHRAGQEADRGRPGHRPQDRGEIHDRHHGRQGSGEPRLRNAPFGRAPFRKAKEGMAAFLEKREAQFRDK